MKVIIVALALVAVAASAAVPAEYKVVPIVRSESNQSPDGSYNFAFETDDGIKREEAGEVKEALDEDNKPVPVVVVRGSYSYTDSEGNVENIIYTADENGFHPEGKSIPQPPSRR